MKFIISLAVCLIALTSVSLAEEPSFFELRTYTANEGKLDALHTRFRDHTLALFEKHGMTNLIYWVPVENEGNQLVYLLGYPDRDARDASWKAFRDDPDWKAAYKASTADGKLVAEVESKFLTPTDYSPALATLKTDPAKLYEMRIYTTNPEKLGKLDSRFRDHTVGLFEKHGITNLPYFHLTDDQEGSDVTLLYFISADSKEARDASFKAFSEDPAWAKARDESQLDGKLLIKGGVQSTFLRATDYSPAE